MVNYTDNYMFFNVLWLRMGISGELICLHLVDTSL